MPGRRDVRASLCSPADVIQFCQSDSRPDLLILGSLVRVHERGRAGSCGCAGRVRAARPWPVIRIQERGSGLTAADDHDRAAGTQACMESRDLVFHD